MKGKFQAVIKIDNEIYNEPCFIISKTDIDDEMIVGYDLIQQSELKITPNGISFKKIQPLQKTTISDREPVFVELCGINYISKRGCEIDDLSHLDKNLQSKIYELVTNYSPRHDKICPIEMEIVLHDEIPVNTKPRRLAPSERTELDEQIKKWLTDGVIRHSYSDYAAQVLFKPKKDGTKRLCVDYRRLNKKIVRDRFPIPNLEDQLDQLQTGNVFTTLDLKNGYHHVPVKESSRKYTAFVTPTGQYEFNRVSFGLSNSPSVFCRYIQIIFRQLISQGIVVTYMDDIIIIANNDDEAITRLKIVLDLAASFNLTMNWKK